MVTVCTFMFLVFAHSSFMVAMLHFTASVLYFLWLKCSTFDRSVVRAAEEDEADMSSGWT